MLESNGFLALRDIIGQSAVTPEEADANRQRGKGPRRARPAIPALLPVKKSAFWVGVKQGRYPQPVRLGGGRCLWKAQDWRDFITNAR